MTDEEKAKFKSALMVYALPVFVLIDLAFFGLLIYGEHAGYSDTFIKIFVAIAFVGYHATYRLVVVRIVSLFRPLINPNRWWHKIDAFEMTFYELIKVKQWKDKVPAWNRTHFMLSMADIRNIDKVAWVLRFNICAEIMHHINFYLSLFGTLFCLFKGMQGYWYIFALASLLVGCFADAPFAMIQRYNRYRLIPIYQKLQQRELKKEIENS